MNKQEIRGDQIRDETITSEDILLDFSKVKALKAEKIPFDATQNIKSKIDNLSHNDLQNRDAAGNHSKLTPLTNSITAIQITKADGTTTIFNVDTLNNRVGISQTSPTARLHLPAGGSQPGSASLKIDMSDSDPIVIPEDGAFEYSNSHLYFTIGSTRYQLDQQSPSSTNHNDLLNRDVAGNHSKLIPSTDSIAAIQITKADGTTAVFNIDTLNSRIGILQNSPTARIHLPAGTNAAGTAPIKLTSGAPLTGLEDGVFEYHDNHLYFTIGSTRYQLDQQSSSIPSLPSGTLAQTLYHNGTDWVATSNLTHDGTNTDGRFFERVVAANSGTAYTVDWTQGGVQNITLTGNCTLTFTAPNSAKRLNLVLTQDSTGNRTIVYPSTLLFPENIPIILNRAPNAKTITELYYDGTNYNFIGNVEIGEKKSKYFYSVATDTCSGITAAAVAGGTTGQLSAEPGTPTTKRHNGIARISSSKNDNSGYSFITGNTYYLCSGGDIFEQIFRIDYITSIIRFGFHDCKTYADAVDGIYFESSNGTLTGKTSASSTRSTTATSYTLTAATWYKTIIVVRYDYARVDYYLYDDAGTLLWTNNLTSNFPVATTGVGLIATASTDNTQIVTLDKITWGNQSQY